MIFHFCYHALTFDLYCQPFPLELKSRFLQGILMQETPQVPLGRPAKQENQVLNKG